MSEMFLFSKYYAHLNLPYFPANKSIFWTYFCDLIFWGRLIGRVWEPCSECSHRRSEPRSKCSHRRARAVLQVLSRAALRVLSQAKRAALRVLSQSRAALRVLSQAKPRTRTVSFCARRSFELPTTPCPHLHH